MSPVDVDRLIDWERPVFELVLQRLAIVIGHHDEHLPLGRFVDVVDNGYAGVVEGGSSLGLMDKASLRVPVGLELWWQENISR